jgi:ABC-type transporter Mla maintaining outer membrane lipid asymmetry permease subunit MlaE
MSARILALVLALTILAPVLTACGRVGAPTAPAGVPNIYPKAYPSADQH